jgi:ligand-binding sensor domain-containing protein
MFTANFSFHFVIRESSSIIDHMYLKYRLLLLFLVIASAQSFAQQLLFRRLEVARKLSDTHIYKVEEDEQGFLWLATNKGILKYNGSEFHELELPDSIKNVKVECIHVSKNQVLAGLHNGMIVWKNGSSNGVTKIQKVSGVAITCCTIDQAGNAWLGTNGVGLYRLDGNGNQIHFTDRDQLPDNQINDALILGEKLIVATDLGAAVINTNNLNSKSQILTLETGLTDNFVTVISESSNSTALLGTEGGGVFEYYPNNGSLSTLMEPFGLHPQAVNELEEISDKIWTFYANNSSYIFSRSNFAEGILLELNNSISNRSNQNISDLVYDKEGNLIVTTGQNELLVADTRILYFINHDNVSLDGIKALTCDSKNNLWLVTKEGIFMHSTTFSDNQLLLEYYRIPKNKPFEIISICEGPDGAIWFGTFGNGLGRLDLKNKKVTFIKEKDGLINNNIFSITRNGPDLWLATLGGVSKAIIGKKIQFESWDKTSALGTNFVYGVYTDKDGALWIACDGKGAVKYTQGQFIFLRDQYPSLGKSITSIVQDVNGSMWFNSTDKGVQKFDGSNVWNAVISQEEQRPEVFAMQPDRQGNVLLFTSIGLGIIKSGGLNMLFVNADDTYNTEYLNVSTIDNFGQIWIGTSQQLVRFQESVDNVRLTPKTMIEDVMVLLQSTDTTNHDFAYNQNHFTFHIAGLWYQQPDLINYQYKLEGFNPEWVNTRDHQIAFPKLPPGKYVFHVRASNGANWLNAEIKTYAFTIHTPYWKSWWFIVTVLISLGLSTWLIIRIRIRTVRRKADLQRERIQSQFETLRNQVNPHFLFNSFNTLISIIETDANSAVDYVEKLSDYFRIILEQRDRDVITLEEEVELVKAYLFLQRKRFGDNLIVEFNIDPEFNKSFIPPLCLQILAENVIKHNIITKAKPLHLEIATRENWIEIRNTLQPKSTKEPSTGVGLPNIRNRYEVLFGKQISVLSEANTFLVRLPLVEQRD